MAKQLAVKTRDSEKKAKALRREGRIPATVYGPDVDSYNVDICQREFRKMPAEDYTHVIEINEEGKEPFNTLIKRIQKHPLSGEVQNIEFYKLKKGHKVQMRVKIHFTGDSEAVKMGAELATNHDSVHIKCLPRHIPDHFEVDLTTLKEEGDHVTFADLKLDEEIELLDPAAEIICKAEAKKVAHDLGEDEAPAAEGEEGAEGAEGGEAAADGEAAKAENGEAKKD